MIISLIMGLAVVCMTALLPGAVTSDFKEAAMYEVRGKIYNPFGPNGIYENMRLIYQAGDKRVVLEADDVTDWVRYWEDGHWDIDDDKIAEFISGLKKEFDTWDYYKILETTADENTPSRTVRVRPGEYGWRLDVQTETKEISKFLRRNWTTIHSLHFSSEAALFGDPSQDYGDSYVEIDLTRQKLWMYVDGELQLSTDIVSGMMNTDRQTPEGAYAVYYRQSPAVLKGEDYETPVTFWMPFNHGIGLHDATWQYSFGGDACYYRGSHGCINLPYDAAQQIYEMIWPGFPVLCYY